MAACEASKQCFPVVRAINYVVQKVLSFEFVNGILKSDLPTERS